MGNWKTRYFTEYIGAGKQYTDFGGLGICKQDIFGGDFNIRNKEARLQHALNALGKDAPYILPRYYCVEINPSCEIRLNLRGGRPWAKTQDLQGFANGHQVSVEPVRIKAMFDGGVFGEELSDHDGYLVEYIVRWK